MSWRNHIKIHPAAEMFPLLADDELFALGEDIRHNGLANSIVCTVDNDEPILVDGRNRLDAIERIGLQVNIVKSHTSHWWLIEAFGADGEQIDLNPDGGILFSSTIRVISNPIEYVISANIHRRHLSAGQKRELIERLLKESPVRSNRATAALVKVDHKTVGTVRKEMETRGELPHVDKVVDTRGRQQPASKPDKRRSASGQYSAKETASRQRGAFILRAEDAISFAFYEGNVDAEMIVSAKATAAAWCDLVEKMEASFGKPVSGAGAALRIGKA